MSNPTTVTADRQAARGIRVANLRLRRVEPWEAMKTGFVFALGLGIIWLVASVLIFFFADASGVFESFNTTVADLSGGSGPFNFNMVSVVAVNAVVAAIEVVVFTLMVGVLAVLYNAAAAVTGGIRVKLAED